LYHYAKSSHLSFQMRLAKLSVLFFIAVFVSVNLLFAQKRMLVENLPLIPDSDGFAGSLAGVSNGRLLVAGGSNFPNGGRPWTGATKTWYDGIFLLETPQSQWKKVGVLPRPLGYAVTVSWRDAVVCVGGSNQQGHVAEAFLMRWKNHQIAFEALPDFPHPIANACGALVGNTLYVAGGLETPNSPEALKKFYALDLAASPRVWKTLSTWEGEGRMLSVAASAEGKFYLISGAALTQDKATGVISRVYLKEVHRFDPKKQQWERLPDLPHATVAAASPALVVGNKVVVLGGDTGEWASQTPVLKDKHPGFSTDMLEFSPVTNRWKTLAPFPVDIRSDADIRPNESTYLPVTTSFVFWKGGYVIPGGEARPGTRTPRVIWIK